MAKSKSVKRKSYKTSNKRNHTNKRRHKECFKFFTKPIKPNLSDSIFNHNYKNSGNIIPGLRNHLRK